MKVYFVRHGVSELGEGIHQLPETHLSKEGIGQAQAIAKRLDQILFDLIISSPYKRTLQTAEEIQKVKRTPLIASDLFIERKMPSSFLGKPVKDPEIYPILETMRAHFFEPNWHYADEENFTDLIKRSKKALEFIQSQNKENVVVVTHGYFLSVMIYSILFYGAETSQFRQFRSRTQFSNTGLTLCEYDQNKWKVVTMNDLMHLG